LLTDASDQSDLFHTAIEILDAMFSGVVKQHFFQCIYIKGGHRFAFAPIGRGGPLCLPTKQPFSFSGVLKESTGSEFRHRERLCAVERARRSQDSCIVVKSPDDLQTDRQSIFCKTARQ
jgi:hypothetical protein